MSAASFTSRHKPFDPGPAAWNEILPDRSAFAALENNITADVAIIGAGFAGLSAARRLMQHDPKLKVVVLEARTIAEGPAGRNSGFMIDLPHDLSSSNYSGKADHDQERTAMNRRAIAFAGEAAGNFSMPAEAFVRCGKINAAATEAGVKHNRDYADHLSGLRETCEQLDAKQMEEICGSGYYKSGVFTPGTAMLQPALYIRELARGLARQGVSIFENSRVETFKSEQGDWYIKTSGGSVSAKKIILAANGHAESFGFFKRRLVHIYLFASMTKALSKDEEKLLGGKSNWGFTPSDPLGSTVRKVSGIGGTRLVIRNGIQWAPDRKTNSSAASLLSAQHDRTFAARYPKLAGTEMQYRWGGLLCLSMNGVPAYGELEPGLISACCQNGLGTAFGTLSGMAAADQALAIESPEASFLNSHQAPSLLPPGPIAGFGARLRFWWGQRKAGAEL